MVGKALKKSLSLLIIIITVICQIPYISASENSSDSFSDDTTFQIHETSADGPVVAENIDGELVWYKQFEPDKDYYADIAVERSLGGKYLEVTTGKCQDGSLSGVKFQNMPGQDGGLKVKDLDQSSALSKIVYYEDYPDKEYGSNNKKYKMDDGKLIYRIAESKNVQEDKKIGFSLGFKIDPVLYNNASSLMDALTIKIGEYDPNTQSVIAMVGYEQSVNIDNIVRRSSSTTYLAPYSVSAILDESIAVDQFLRIGNTGDVRFIYKSLDFDLYIPDGVSLNGIGFDLRFTKSDENAGTISVSELRYDNDGKSYYHITLRDGMKSISDLQIHFSNTVSSSVYKIDDKIYIQAKNICASLVNGETYTFENSNDMVITVIDPENDASALAPHDRVIYNSTIDTDEKYNIQLGRCSVRNPGSADTPYDKIFEAEYNTNNSDAVITAITIPVGLSENPEIIVNGYDGNKNPVTYTVPDPRKYIFKTSANSKQELSEDTYDYGYLIFASDCGMAEIKSVKATIGKIKAQYNTDEPWSTVQYYEYSVGGCYGYFTNESSGIQVTSTYHLYNEIPAYRTRKNGDLFATSVYTSTDRKSLAMASSSLFVKSWHLDENGNMEAYKEEKVSISSAETAPSVSPGDYVKLSSSLFPYHANFSTFETNNTKDAMVTNPATDQYCCTVEYLADPVFYLTLPNDFRLEDIEFTQDERKTNISSEADNNLFLKNHTDSVYYSKDNYNWTSRPLNYTIENITYMNKTGDGRNLYKITFPKEERASIGRYSEDGKMKRITYSVTLVTSKSSATKRYPMSDLMQLSGENPYYGGVYNDRLANTCYTVYDRYGLNDNHDISGVTYGAYELGSQWGFSLQKLSDVNSYNFIKATEIDSKPVSQDWQTYTSTDPNTVVLLGAKSKGQYKLQIQNTDVTHPTRKLQAVVPIPKYNVDIGDAFMNNPMKYSMDFTWDENNVPDGFTIKYINIQKTSSKDLESDLNYTECKQSEANAILIETEHLEPNRVVDFYFDFVIGDDATPGKINIFKNSIRYYDFAGNIQTRKGSEVAVEVARGKISGKAFYDENRNALYDDENPVKGVDVRVVDSLGKFQYVTTDENGNYEFSAVRETDVTITFSIDKSSEYRMNVPAKKLTLSSDCLSASNSYSSLVEEELDLPLDKYVTLSYNANPPSGKTVTGVIPKTSEYYKNQEAKVSAKPDSLQVKNFKFVNWNTKADGSGTSYEPNETFNITENTVLYAQWEKVQLYLTFDFQGGSVATFNKNLLNKSVSNKTNRDKILASINQENLEKGLVKIPIEEKESIRSAMTRYFFGHKETDDNNLYQLWFIMPISNNDAEYMNKEYGISYYNYFRTTKNGYDAIVRNNVGNGPWYVKNANGTTSDISFGSYFTESTTIYLRWTPKSGYTVKYDSDGGTAFEDSKDLNWESNVDNLAKSKVPVKKGYIFSHWEYNGEKITNNASYGDLAVIDTVESLTLKAVYTTKTYKVNYDSNGGTTVEFRNVAFDQVNMNSLTAPSKADSVFEGWSTDGTQENMITTEETYSDIVGGNENTPETTLYAVWKEATDYTVQFDTNGGTSVADKTGLAFTDKNLIGDTVTARNGYVFDRWTLDDKNVTDSDTYSSLVKEDVSVMNVTLVANWIPKSYIVKYTNVETPIADKSAKWEDNSLLPVTNPERKGYKFTGWTFESKVVTQSKTVSSLISNDDAVDNTLVMTANWERIKYTVVYDSDGGTYVSPLVDKTIDTTNLLPSNISKEGYSFEGWYNENSVKVTSSTTIGDVLIGDETIVHLKAKWVPKTNFTVKYNLVGGTISGSTTVGDKSVSWTESNLIPAEEPVKKGYEFKGWSYSTKSVDNTTTFGYLAGTESNNSITLVALWEQKEIKLEPTILGATLYIENKFGVNFYVDFGAKAVKQTNGTYVIEDVNDELFSSFEMHFKFKDKYGNYLNQNGNITTAENAYEVVKPYDENEVSIMNVGGTAKPLYRFTHWCYAFEMADTIEAAMYQYDGSDVVQVTEKSVTYSVQTYAKNKLNSASSSASLKSMLVNLLNYGTYSQKYWNHNTDNLANSILTDDQRNMVTDNNLTIDSKYQVKKKLSNGITVDSLTIGFDEGASFDIRLKVVCEKGQSLGDFVASLEAKTDAGKSNRVLIDMLKDGQKVTLPYTITENEFVNAGAEGEYYLTIENIPVYRWDDTFALKFTGKTNGETDYVEFSLLSYVYQAVNDNSSDSSAENLVNLLKSMYLYNQNSDSYFKEVEEYEHINGIIVNGVYSVQ